MRGRRPAPVELKVLRGEMRPSRVNRRAPQPRATPTPPRGMPVEQRHIFREVVAEIEAMGVSCGSDAAIIEVFAGMVWHHRQARTDLATGGYTTTNARGGEVSRPAWRVYRDTGREIACRRPRDGATQRHVMEP